ncbi:hypothetical protein M9H77_26105 [Catharanthus roseus]|uniref:Uncharacterized protein n=1 Tax=Catharanthus roseus TaxID=4058 RepID=A0ACC0A8Q9_CATRO|nr:hypothetical protein M9H77_26105 [Catharanthus roseus]
MRGGSGSINREGVLKSRVDTSEAPTAVAVNVDVEVSAHIMARTRGIIGGNRITVPSGNPHTPPSDACGALLKPPMDFRLPILPVLESGSSYSLRTGLYMQGYSNDSTSQPSGSHQSTAASCSFLKRRPTNPLIGLSSLTPIDSWSWGSYVDYEADGCEVVGGYYVIGGVGVSGAYVIGGASVSADGIPVDCVPIDELTLSPNALFCPQAIIPRLGDAFAHNELYKELHTHRDDHEKAGQFVDHCPDEFWASLFLSRHLKNICTSKTQKTEEHRQNGAPMPTYAELMYEVGMGLKRGHAYGFGVAKSACLRQQARAATKALFPITRGPAADYLHQLHLARSTSLPLNAVGISLSELGYLELPPVWQMPNYPIGEGTSYANPRGEDDHPREKGVSVTDTGQMIAGHKSVANFALQLNIRRNPCSATGD